MQMGESRSQFYAKHARKPISVGDNGAVVDSLGTWQVVAAKNRVRGMAPDKFVRTGGARLPGDLGQESGSLGSLSVVFPRSFTDDCQLAW